MSDWREVPFENLYKRINAKNKQVQTSQVKPHGSLPVVDQGKSAIAGYTDDLRKQFIGPFSICVGFRAH